MNYTETIEYIHSTPKFSRILGNDLLRKLLERFGINLPEVLNAKVMQNVLNKVKGKNIEEPVTALVLTASKNAYYSSINEGHLGVGVEKNIEETYPNFQNVEEDQIENARREYFKRFGNPRGLYFKGDIKMPGYGHTTSPIRRGPDVINHMQMLSLIYDKSIMFEGFQFFPTKWTLATYKSVLANTSDAPIIKSWSIIHLARKICWWIPIQNMLRRKHRSN